MEVDRRVDGNAISSFNNNIDAFNPVPVTTPQLHFRDHVLPTHTKQSSRSKSTPAKRTNFGAGPDGVASSAVESGVETGVKTGLQAGVQAGLTGWQILGMVVFVAMSAATFFYVFPVQLPYYLNTERPFFNNVLPLLTGLAGNVISNDTATYVTCAQSPNNTILNVCNMNDRLIAVEEVVGLNTSGTIPASMVFDSNFGLTQDILNGQFSAGLSSANATANSALAAGSAANATANAAAATASAANITANAVAGIATAANATANAASAAAAAANTTANAVAGIATAANTTANAAAATASSANTTANGALSLAQQVNITLTAHIAADQITNTTAFAAYALALLLNGTVSSLQTANGTVTLQTLAYTNGAAFMSSVTNGKAAFDTIVAELLSLETMPGSHIVYVEMTGNNNNCQLANPRLPCADPKRALALIGNLTDSNTPWIIAFGTGYWIMDPTFYWPCNVHFVGTETTYLYLNGTTLSSGMATQAGGTCIVKFLWMIVIPQTDIVIDYSPYAALTYVETDWLNCTVAYGAFTVTFVGNTNYNVMSFDTVTTNSLTAFVLVNFHWNSANNGIYYIPMVMQSTNGKNLIYDVRDAQLLSYFNVSSYGAVTTLIKMFRCVEESGAPTLFNVYGNNTINVLECDVESCGLRYVNENSFTGPAAVAVRRNTDAQGLAVNNYGDFTTSNWPAITFPTTSKKLHENTGLRLKQLETQSASNATNSVWKLLNRGIYPSGTISPAITVPSNVYEIVFEIIGGGGGGSGAASGVFSGCGGGAGAKTVVIAPTMSGDTFDGYIGVGGGDSLNGESSYICINTYSGGNLACYYAGGGGGASTGTNQCQPGAGGSNGNGGAGLANFGTAGVANADTNAYDGATAGAMGCASVGVNGKSTGIFGSGSSGGCAGYTAGSTYGGKPPLPAQPGHTVFGGGDGAPGWANSPGQGAPDIAGTTCNGGAAQDGGGGGGGGSKLLSGFDPCPSGGTGGNGGNGLIFYQFRYYA